MVRVIVMHIVCLLGGRPFYTYTYITIGEWFCEKRCMWLDRCNIKTTLGTLGINNETDILKCVYNDLTVQ